MDKFYRFARMEKGGHRLDITGSIVQAAPSWAAEEGMDLTGGANFRDELKAIDGEDLTIVIDSPGGDVGAGVAMYEAIRQRKGKTSCVVLRAYSAATLPLVAVPKGSRLISPAGTVMIHDPSSYADGNAEELEKCATFLRSIKGAVLAAYVEGTGLDEETLSTMMTAETMMTAQEAIENGFADRVIDRGEMDAVSAELKRSVMAASREATMKMLHTAAKAADEDRERQEILEHLQSIALG